NRLARYSRKIVVSISGTRSEKPLLNILRDLIRSLPVRSASGLPVHVAAFPAAPFSTEPVLSEVEGLDMTGGKLVTTARAPSGIAQSGILIFSVRENWRSSIIETPLSGLRARSISVR